MKKAFYIMREMVYLIKRHKLAFFAPMLIILALLAFLLYYVGPAVITTFIYAGV